MRAELSGLGALMYDVDYEDWKEEQAVHTPHHGSTDKVCHPEQFKVADYITKDSGKQAEYADGMKRDTTEDKPRFDLLIPEGFSPEETLLWRVAMLYMRGGVKYGDRNWEKSSTPESLAHHTAALWRHFIKFVMGVEDGEDHAAAVVWNVNAVLLTRAKIEQFEAAKQKNFEAIYSTFSQPGPDVSDWKSPEPEVEPELVPEVVVHACPPGKGHLTTCCHKSPFDLLADKMTLDPSLVTCPGWAEQMEKLVALKAQIQAQHDAEAKSLLNGPAADGYNEDRFPH